MSRGLHGTAWSGFSLTVLRGFLTSSLLALSSTMAACQAPTSQPTSDDRPAEASRGAGHPSKADARKKRTTPVAYTGRFIDEPLTQDQVDEILSKADPLVPVGERIWFILTRRNSESEGKLDYVASVYFTPEQQGKRMRRGNFVSFDSSWERFIGTLTKSLGGNEDSPQPDKRLQSYCQVSLAKQPFGDDLKTPQGTLLPFAQPVGFTDAEIIEVVAFLRTSPGQSQAPNVFLTVSKLDGSAPIISIKKAGDGIEVQTGSVEGFLSGTGTFMRCIRTESGFKVVSLGQWVS